MRKVAFYVLNGFAVLATLFISGYAFEDPGGWQGVGLMAGIVVPMVVLGLLAWRFPDGMHAPLLAISLISVVISWSQAYWQDSWREFLNRTGPVLATSTFALVFALSVYARYHDEFFGGVLMVIVAISPILAMFVVLGAHVGLLGGSTSAMLLPGVVIGFVYAVEGYLNRSNPTSRRGTKRGASVTGSTLGHA